MTDTTDAQPASDALDATPAPEPNATPGRPPSRWKGLAAALVVGLVIGVGIGAGAVALLTDPTDSDEYQALQEDLRAAERSGSSAESDAPAASSSAAPSSPAEDGPPVGELGQAMTNKGVTLTVTAARVADVIELNQSNYRQGSGNEKYTQVPPDAGGKFVIVETHIMNNAQVSMDLTCGYPIATALVDNRDRQFDPIDNLYEIRDNPECNDQLQPGFESNMTYIYMVPADAKIAGFGFSDATELGGSNDYTGIRLTL